ncbi:imidazolonepropionase [Bacilli bacterium PM5-3]|nr:imidazolonepropionase [Bacilli bacterium PM5-3]MDH6604059.1 imidazolonepropionase [Bacilli bacterium PM5-9]
MKTIIYNIGKLYTMKNKSVPLKKKKLNECEIIENAYVVINDEKIEAVGTGDYSQYVEEYTELFDAEGKIALPGLIDAHTHLVFGGSREHEYALKLEGADYLDILRGGGGILNTVEATRNASFDDLYYKSMNFADSMLLHGVTTFEAKSGYGLNLETEVKQLKVARKVAEDHPCDIVSTFMPAHAIPKEYKENPEDYIELVINELLPEVAKMDLAKYVDIFCEDAVFNKDQSKRILEKAQELGYTVKIHADEVVPMGGAALAAELHALSAEHLMATPEEDMDAMAKSNVIANLLPATTFNLGKDYARARMMIDKGLAVTICSDFNPGSCPNENLQLTLQIASRGYAMTPIEVYNSAIVNGSCSLEMNDVIGSVEAGKQADIVIMDAPNIEFTIYHFGVNHVAHVFKKGELVVEDQMLV